MRYYSLNKNAPSVDFRAATINGQAPDKGLYFPEKIPQLPDGLIASIESMTAIEIAYEVIKPYIGDVIPRSTLRTIVTETLNFPIPLVRVNESISSLELFHGPTLAFKDIGARFMSRCLGYFLKEEKRKVIVLVATSGDTGGAVANGFLDVEGVEVVILYPSGKVSPVQEKQLTTAGKNIHALEVMGSFDDCQAMVKTAFADTELKQNVFLTSANSINVARWLPQQFYYFMAFQQWEDKKQPPVISVPSGNFGNICAGLLAWSSGLPVSHFIAATNANDIAVDFLSSGNLVPRDAVATLSNAMDVGNPSNFIRIIEMFQNSLPAINQVLSARSVTDSETINTITGVYSQYNYLLDPHGAVGYLALEEHLQQHPQQKGFFLETAHPVKFPEAVEKVTGFPVPVPPGLIEMMQRQKQATVITTEYSGLSEILNSF